MEESTKHSKLVQTYLKRRGISTEDLDLERQRELYSQMRSASNKAACSSKRAAATREKSERLLSAEQLLELVAKRSAAAARGRRTFLENESISTLEMNDEQVSKLYYEKVKKLQMLGRGSTLEERRQSYRKAIEVKGKRMAEEACIDTSSLSSEDLMSFSGLHKKSAHAALSSAEKEAAARRWKETHLLNFFNEDFSVKSLQEVDNKYREYLFLSGRLRRTAELATIASKRYKTQWVETCHGRFFCRSSYEADFIRMLGDADVEEIRGNLEGIPYMFEDKQRYYFPDFLVKIQSGAQVLVEIKAEWMLSDLRTLEKIRAGEKFARANGFRWKLIRKHHLSSKEELLKEIET